MAAINKIPYLGYLNKLADECNNSYHYSFGKKPVDADYSPLTEDLNAEKIIGSFYEKELLLSKLKMSYYLEPYSHIRDKVKVVLDL